MEDLISPYSGGKLYRDGDYYSTHADGYLYTIGENGNVITLMDPISAGRLEILGNDLFFSEGLMKNFIFDRNREIVVPLYLDNEDAYDYSYENATYDGVSLVGNNTGRRVVVDNLGERLTGLELLKQKSREFQGTAVIEGQNRILYSSMTEDQRKVFDLTSKQMDEYTTEDIETLIDGLVGKNNDDPYLILARSALSTLFQIKLSNEPLIYMQETIPESNEEEKEFIKRMEIILNDSNEPEYQFEEYQKPSDYDERVYAIGMAVLENGIHSMSREDYEYLYNSVDKKKAYENNEIDKKDLKVMEVSLEYLKNLETSRSR